MNLGGWIRAAALLAVAAQAATAQSPDTAVAAQGGGARLNGLVIDAEGAPVSDVPIALHRVVATGGAVVEEVASDSTGRFVVLLAPDEPPNALYFVAARYRGELFIGPTLRPPFPDGAEYVVQVGLDATSAARMARGVDPDQVFIRPPASPWRWGIAAAVLAAVIGFLIALGVRARGPDARRRLLIRIAELDESQAEQRHADGVAGQGTAVTAGAPDEDYQARRDELLDRLRAGP